MVTVGGSPWRFAMSWGGTWGLKFDIVGVGVGFWMSGDTWRQRYKGGEWLRIWLASIEFETSWGNSFGLLGNS